MTPHLARARKPPRRPRWDFWATERRKAAGLIAEIAKGPAKPETLRIAVFEIGGRYYLDVSSYLRGRYTGRGVMINSDILPEVLAALQKAADELYARERALGAR